MVNLKKIKCVIVDFDKTLYSEANLSTVDAEYSRFFEDFGLLEKTKNYKEILTENRGFHMAQCIFKIARENKISDKKVRDWFDNHIYDITCEGMRIVRSEIIKQLCKKYPVYILSDSCKGHLYHYIDMFGYKKSWFKAILPNKFTDEEMTKIPQMIEIVKKNQLKPSEVLMVGDSIRSDIKAASKVGLQWEHVGTIDDTERIFLQLIQTKG